MTSKKKTLIFCISLPLFIGGLSSLLSGIGNMQSFGQLNQPPLSPPGILFPIVWTILYTLMGIASYLILTTRAPLPDARRAFSLYLLQLVVNFFWSIFFFRFEWYWFSFFWLLLLWVLIILTMLAFKPISKRAFQLMIPYILWVTFAAYLNLGIAILN